MSPNSVTTLDYARPQEFCSDAEGVTIFPDTAQTRTAFDGFCAHNVETIVRPFIARVPVGSSFELMPY